MTSMFTAWWNDLARYKARVEARQAAIAQAETETFTTEELAAWRHGFEASPGYDCQRPRTPLPETSWRPATPEEIAMSPAAYLPTLADLDAEIMADVRQLMPRLPEVRMAAAALQEVSRPTMEEYYRREYEKAAINAAQFGLDEAWWRNDATSLYLQYERKHAAASLAARKLMGIE